MSDKPKDHPKDKADEWRKGVEEIEQIKYRCGFPKTGTVTGKPLPDTAELDRLAEGLAKWRDDLNRATGYRPVYLPPAPLAWRLGRAFRRTILRYSHAGVAIHFTPLRWYRPHYHSGTYLHQLYLGPFRLEWYPS